MSNETKRIKSEGRGMSAEYMPLFIFLLFLWAATGGIIILMAHSYDTPSLYERATVGQHIVLAILGGPFVLVLSLLHFFWWLGGKWK